MTAANVPQWLRDQKLQLGEDQEVFTAPNGTFAVWIEYGDGVTVFDIPTRDLAFNIARAMWDLAEAVAADALVEG